MAKWVAQIDRADRIPSSSPAPSRPPAPGRPGPVVLALPEDMLAARERRRRRPALPARRAAPGAATDRRAARPARGGRAPARDHRRRRLDAGGRRRTSSRSSRRTPCRPARRSAARTRSTTTRRATSATSASASTRRSPSACGRRPSARRRAASRRDDDLRLHAARRRRADGRRCARPSRRRGARPGLSGRAPDPLRHGAVRGGCPRPAGRAALARVDKQARADYEAWQQHGPMPGALDLGDCIAHLRARAAERDRHATAPGTTPSGCIASGGCTATRASSRPRAARWATACRPRSPPRRCARPHRDLLRRRRRLPDDRAGARDRGAVRARRSSSSSSTTGCTERFACIRSATSRAESSAPISSIPTSRRCALAYGALRRERRAHRAVSGRARTRADCRPPSRPGAADRPGGDHPAHHAQCAARAARERDARPSFA